MAVSEGSSKMDNFSDLESEDTDIDGEFFSFLMKAKEHFSKLSIGKDEEQDEEEDSDLQFMRFMAQMKQNHSGKPQENEEQFSVKCSSPSQRKRSHSSPIKSAKANENIDPLERSQSVSKDASFNIFDVETKPTALFTKKRSEYSNRLFHYFNRKVFNNRLQSDMKIVWSDLLQKTAGRTHCKRLGQDHSCHIELSAKVLTSFDRLRDTLLHELCHAAVWIVNKKSDGHGPLWQTWASRCKLILPQIDLPKRCHAYEIAFKYTYNCSKCPYKIGRHSNSIKIDKVVCPKCYSKLVLFKK